MLFPPNGVAMMSEGTASICTPDEKRNTIYQRDVRISVPNMQSTVHAEYAMRSLTYIFCGRNFIERRLSRRFRAIKMLKANRSHRIEFRFSFSAFRLPTDFTYDAPLKLVIQRET